MTLSRCAGNKFEFGDVFYTKSCFHSVLWTNFPIIIFASIYYSYLALIDSYINIYFLNKVR